MESEKSSIDETRIVSPKEAYEPLICMICLNISNNPLLIKCCESISCTNCIDDCIKKNNKCPKCRFDDPQKEVPSRFIMRLFSNLRVKCVYEEKGCSEVTSYENIEQHEMKCQYNPNRKIKCDKCSTELNVKDQDSHDCIKQLSSLVETLTKKIQDLTVEKETTLKDNLNTPRPNHSLIQVPIQFKEVFEEALCNLRVHSKHILIKSSRGNALCDMCCSPITRSDSFNCIPCNFDLCLKCHNYIKTKVEDNRYIYLIYRGHPHNLTIFYHQYRNWGCDICKSSFPYRTSSWKCVSCDFDLCLQCRFRNQ
jgi:hypothetical protein